MTTYDIKFLLNEQLKNDNIKTDKTFKSNQGANHVELQNVQFVCDKKFIIDCEEYDDVKDGSWYDVNYMPRIKDQLEPIINKLSYDANTRQAILMFYHPEDCLINDPPCTIYVHIRLNEISEKHYSLAYTVHMRSNDVKEFKSDLKFHLKLREEIKNSIIENTNYYITTCPILWDTDSIQCFEHSFEFLS